MKEFIVMAGLPAAGKSTSIEKIKNAWDKPLFIYSTDSYIEKIAKSLNKTYDDVFADEIKNATRYMDSGLADAIRQGHDILWDQTNLSKKRRRKNLMFIKTNSWKKTCIYHCVLPWQEDDWKRRLVSRPGKTIPDYIIKNMVASLEQPTLDEGFDEIISIDIYGRTI